MNIYKIVVTGCSFFLALVILVIGSCSYTDYKIAEMVKSGVDPIAAKCSLRDLDRSHCEAHERMMIIKNKECK